MLKFDLGNEMLRITINGIKNVLLIKKWNIIQMLFDIIFSTI